MRSSAPSSTTVTKWAKRFRHVNDHPRSASSLSQLSNENIQLVISNDPHSTYDEIIAEISLSLSWYNRTNYPRLPQDEKVTSRWISHQLTHKQRVKLYSENLANFQSDSW